jgi:hypothetical protein
MVAQPPWEVAAEVCYHAETVNDVATGDQEDGMGKSRKAKTTGSRKRLSLSKRTVKDLSTRGKGPKGGLIMRDTVIVNPLSRNAC